MNHIAEIKVRAVSDYAPEDAALLCAVAVVALAPRAFTWQLPALALAAGAIGGVAFEVELPFDPDLVVGHAAWQLLVCLALHFGLQSAPT